MADADHATKDDRVVTKPGEMSALRATGQKGRVRSEQQRAIATKAQIVEVARKCFGARGYHATGTNDIVEQAKVTRGALYHHFSGKEALFEAVYRQVAEELSRTAQEETRGLAGQLWDRIFASVETYLKLLAQQSDWQQILIIDGPAVFGWKQWREVQRETLLPQWEETLERLKAAGLIEDYPTTPTAHLLVALLDDAALSLAHSTNQDAALGEVMTGLAGLLQGLKLPPP